MKKVITLMLMCLFYAEFHCQTNTSIANDVNAKFSLLEKNRIPHDILIDYGYEFIDIREYDGVLRTDNYMSIGVYKQIYNTLVSSQTSNVSGLNSPVQEYDNWADTQIQVINSKKTTNSANIVLSGLLYNYSNFNLNALSNNKIQVVNGKYDDKYVNEVWQNPYDTRTTFAMSSSTVLINRSEVNVTLPSYLWHSNI